MTQKSMIFLIFLIFLIFTSNSVYCTSQIDENFLLENRPSVFYKLNEEDRIDVIGDIAARTVTKPIQTSKIIEALEKNASLYKQEAGQILHSIGLRMKYHIGYLEYKFSIFKVEF